MSRFGVVSVLLVAMTAAVTASGADRVVGWRGDGTGRYPQADPPLKWSTQANVVWRTPMKNWSNATPTVVGKRLFTWAEPSTLICVSTVDGKVLWERTLRYEDVFSKSDLAGFAEMNKQAAGVVAELEKIDVEIRKLRTGPNSRSDEVRNKIRKLNKARRPLDRKRRSLDMLALPSTHKVNGYSTPTPVSDGKRVYVLLATGVAACFDMNGKRIWARLIEKPTAGHGHSASPVLVGGKLIVHVLRPIALDAATGEEVWRAKSRPNWGSPVVARIDGQDVIITTNGEVIRAADGTVLARRVSSLQFCAPVVSDGVAYFIENGGKAVKLPDTISADARFEALWTTRPKKDRYYASPVVHEGLIYAITRGGVLSVIDAADGSVVYEKKLDMGRGTMYPSIVLGGKYLFVSIDSGTTVVLDPGRRYREVARNTLEPFRGTPVFVGKRMYIRGLKNLYCIGPAVARASARRVRRP